MSISLSTAAGSTIALKAVDEAVYVLGGRANTLTLEKIYDAVEELGTAALEEGDDGDNVWGHQVSKLLYTQYAYHTDFSALYVHTHTGEDL